MKKFVTCTHEHIRTYAVLLATILTGLMVLMGPIQDTGDDAMMAWQLSQGIGSLASFIAPYLSLVMNGLYQKFPQIPWWSLMHVVGGWTLLLVLLSQIRQTYPRRNRFILCMVIFAGVWLAIMRQVNFTRTAIAFSLAGTILCLRYIFAKQMGGNIRFWTYLMGACLYLLGTMIRFQAGILILPFVFVLIVLRKIEFRGKQIEVKSKAAGYGFITLVAIGMFLTGMKTVFWNMHPEWKTYQEYSSVRAAIVDYTEFYPSWAEAKEQYKEYGLKDENDLDILLNKAYIGDSDVYSLQTLQSIQGLSRKSIGAWKEVKAGLIRIKQMLTEGNILLWLLLLFLYMIWEKGKHICLPYMVLFCIAGAVLVYFSFAGRMVLRIWEPVLLCVMSLSLVYQSFCFTPSKSEEKKNFCINTVFFGAAILLLFYTGIAQSIWNMKIPAKTDDRDGISRARAEYIQSTPDRIYLLSQPLFHHPPAPSPFGIWEPIPQNYLENYFALSNWEANTPTNLNKLEMLGITNATKALIERADTYSEFMDDKTFRFLKSHYGSNITCSFVDKFPDGGAVVQYASPIESGIQFPEFGYTTTLLKSEANIEYQIKAWDIEGKINGWSKSVGHEAMYCNIIKADGQTYSFRVACDDNGYFSACFYDIDVEWLADVKEVNLIELTSDGQYILVGILEDTNLVIN